MSVLTVFRFGRIRARIKREALETGGGGGWGGVGGGARPEQKVSPPASFPFWRNRPDLLKALWERLLEQMCLTEQEAMEGHLGTKTEKMLRQVAVQLRGRSEFGHFIQASSSPVPPDEVQWPRGVQLVQGAEASKAEQKDASVQTSAMEGDTLRSGHEGPREAWEEQPADAEFRAGRRLEEPCRMLGRQATAPAFPRRTEKVSSPTRSLLSHPLPAPYLVTSCLQSKHLKITSDPTTFQYLSSLVSPLPVLILTST